VSATAPAPDAHRGCGPWRLALGVLTVLLVVPVAVLVPGAGRAWADETALPEGPGLGGAGGAVRYAVPPGITPTALEATLTVDTDTDVGDQEVSVLVGERVAATVPAETGPITVPVSRDDLVDGALTVRLALGDDRCPPGSDAAPITLTGLTLVHDGVELEPTGPEDFWPGFSSRIDVVVPGRADDGLVEVGLNAVAALSRRYGPDTPVLLSSASTRLPRTGFGQRILRLSSGDGPLQARLASRFGLPELDLEGGDDELRSAVRALAFGDDLGADAPAPPEPGLTRTFADLGAARVDLGGDDGRIGSLRVPQDAFGQQVGGLRIRAVGSRGDVAASDDEAGSAPTTAVQTYVNDVLVQTTALDPDDDTVSIDATADRSVLLPTNEVRFVVAATTADAGGSTCAAAGAPTVTLDGEASGVAATPDESGVTGLAAYPQNLGDQLAVAVRPTGGLRVPAAGDAAAVVSSLQGASAGLLDVSVVDADELVAGSDPGLLAGADIDDAATLGAPLQYQESVDEGRPAPDTDVDVTQLFAALEAAGGDDRAVLVLGAFGPGGREEQVGLRATTARAAADLGWNALDGDLLVTARDGEPTVLAAPAPTTGPAAPGQDRSGLGGGWLAAAVAALLALLGLQVHRGLRRDHRARDVAEDVTA